MFFSELWLNLYVVFFWRRWFIDDDVRFINFLSTSLFWSVSFTLARIHCTDCKISPETATISVVDADIQTQNVIPKIKHSIHILKWFKAQREPDKQRIFGSMCGIRTEKGKIYHINTQNTSRLSRPKFYVYVGSVGRCKQPFNLHFFHQIESLYLRRRKCSILNRAVSLPFFIMQWTVWYFILYICWPMANESLQFHI